MPRRIGLIFGKIKVLKIGVLGAGHLGKIHLKLLELSDKFELVGFYDPSKENSKKVSDEFGYHRFNSVEELNVYGEYKVHFDLQRKNFYSVETLKQFERDNLPPDSNAFEDLKEEIFNAVYSKVLANYENSFKKLVSVLNHSTLLNISANPLTVTISLHDKQGICHHLVNESKISWNI